MTAAARIACAAAATTIFATATLAGAAQATSEGDSMLRTIAEFGKNAVEANAAASVESEAPTSEARTDEEVEPMTSTEFDEEEPDKATDGETEPDDANETESIASTAEPDPVIFFGDSRVVGMRMAVDASGAGYDGDSFVGEVGAGFTWMSGDGSWALNEALEASPKSDVAFCFGVNDPGDVGAYADWFTSWRNSHQGTDAYFSSVWPIDDAAASAYGYYVNDAQVVAFDAAMAAAIGEDATLDIRDEILERGFSAPDGIHFSDGTYLTIREVVKEAIAEKKSATDDAK